jgi:hypothetical protein
MDNVQNCIHVHCTNIYVSRFVVISYFHKTVDLM